MKPKHLIAAAPDLFEALVLAHNYIASRPPVGCGPILNERFNTIKSRLERAIQKALGDKKQRSKK